MDLICCCVTKSKCARYSWRIRHFRLLYVRVLRQLAVSQLPALRTQTPVSAARLQDAWMRQGTFVRTEQCRIKRGSADTTLMYDCPDCGT